MLYRSKLDSILFLLILIAQVLLWFFVTKPVKPEMEVVPDMPSLRAVKALSFGDEQFFFRVLGMQLQNAGDSFGRSTPLHKYDYKKLSQWFYLLDTLDKESNYIPALAGYYYAQTQNWEHVHYIVDYLERHYDNNPAGKGKWWWLYQAMYNANYKMKDLNRALELSKKLANAPGELPIWARQMPAFFYEKMGEEDAARKIMVDILDSCQKQKSGEFHCQNLTQGELNFMRHFLEERLRKLKEK